MARFQPGQSGNHKGRKPGNGNAATLRKAIEEHLPDIIDKLADAAKQGNVQAAQVLLSRSLPPLRPDTRPTPIPGIAKGSLSKQGEAIIKSMGAGALTPEQAQSMLAGLASLSKIREIDELDSRLRKLEELSNEKN